MRKNSQAERDATWTNIVDAITEYRDMIVRDLCNPDFYGDEDQEFLSGAVVEANRYLNSLGAGL
jgi:hypothetical protein